MFRVPYFFNLRTGLNEFSGLFLFYCKFDWAERQSGYNNKQMYTNKLICACVTTLIFILLAYQNHFEVKCPPPQTQATLGIYSEKELVSPVRGKIINYASVKKQLCSPSALDATNMPSNSLLAKTRRNYRIVDPPLRSEVSTACSKLFERRHVVWITGPPGSGKTTVTKRFQEYGFMAMDCEDPWAAGNRTKNLIRTSHEVFVNGASSYVFAACFLKILRSKPSFVDTVLLFPNKRVYHQRWTTRNPNDNSKNDKQWLLAATMAKLYKNDASVSIIDQSTSECVDQTVFRICQNINVKHE